LLNPVFRYFFEFGPVPAPGVSGIRRQDKELACFG
jgi:hypothetical protein